MSDLPWQTWGTRETWRTRDTRGTRYTTKATRIRATAKRNKTDPASSYLWRTAFVIPPMFSLILVKDRILPSQLWRKPLRKWFEDWTRRRESLASWSPLRWWSTAWPWHCCFVSLFTLKTFLIVPLRRKIGFAVKSLYQYSQQNTSSFLQDSPKVPSPGIPNCRSLVTHNCVTHRELTLQYGHIINILPRQLSIFVILHRFVCFLILLN